MKRPLREQSSSALDRVRVLTTATDGFGGHGGIALYTRNLLTAVSSHPAHPDVVALPRVMPLAPEARPENLESRVDAIVSIRRHTTRALESWARAKDARTFLLENAIDLSRYGMAPKDPELVARFGLSGKRVIATVSRMGETYIGIDEVIAALGRVAREVPDVVYFVGGDGPDLPRLRAKAEALGVADRVVFAGFVPDERKADYYRLADAYAMPGTGPDFDRYPLRFAFLEAMACGIPVVGATPEDPDEAAVDGALLARQIDPGDTDAVARALVEALALPKAIPPGLARFGYESFERRAHAIVDDLLAGH